MIPSHLLQSAMKTYPDCLHWLNAFSKGSSWAEATLNYSYPEVVVFSTSSYDVSSEAACAAKVLRRRAGMIGRLPTLNIHCLGNQFISYEILQAPKSKKKSTRLYLDGNLPWPTSENCEVGTGDRLGAAKWLGR